MVTTKKFLAGIRRCLALAGLLTLAYLVVFFCWLARIKLPNVPAQRLAPTLLAMLWDWLAGIKWRIVPAGALLLAVMAATAGSTLGTGTVSVTANPTRLEISSGETKTYTLEFQGNPLDHSNVECGDTLSVHLYGGGFLEYVDLEPQSFYYETDKNRDGDCDDEGDFDWYNGSTVTVRVSADATGSASVGIAYQISHDRKKTLWS